MASPQPYAVQPKNSPPSALAVVETSGYTHRAPAQWHRPAMLGASDGVVLVETFMLATGAETQTAKAMLAALIAGAFGKAVREYLSVCSQVDFKLAQIEGEKKYAAIESSGRRGDGEAAEPIVKR